MIPEVVIYVTTRSINILYPIVIFLCPIAISLYKAPLIISRTRYKCNHIPLTLKISNIPRKNKSCLDTFCKGTDNMFLTQRPLHMLKSG